MVVRRGLCRLGLHRWRVVRTPGVAPYTACARCLREQLLDLRPERFMGSTEGTIFFGRGSR